MLKENIMKKLYKRKAWCLDEDVLIEGHVDKYGFHAKSLALGWNFQKVNKKMINNIIFYNLEIAKKKFGNDIEIIDN